MDDFKKYWIGFNLVKGIGSARLRALLDYFGDIQSAWQAPYDKLQHTGLSGRVIDNLLQVRRDVDLDLIWERIQSQHIQVLTWEDEGYPKRLKEIDQPPPVLYVRGSLLAADEWAVAVVGTRRVSAYGRQVAEKIGSMLAQSNITVVSGLARGVDAIAHRSALEAGGRTLAVLGCGVDRIYPPENRHLAVEIMTSGALLSDYAPGTPPEGPNFPPRNRIISGLSLAVVVVEAGERSGALITANFAADQGRDVFAVPGNILLPQSRGVNRLIQDGARPLLDPVEILEALNLIKVQDHSLARLELPSDPVEARLLALLGPEPCHVDDLRNQLALPIEQVTATLTMMELKGMVRQVGGMNYVTLHESPADYDV